jgi:hypothetical protein
VLCDIFPRFASSSLSENLKKFSRRVEHLHFKSIMNQTCRLGRTMANK